MSVPKSRRSQSAVEFEKLYYNLADRIDSLLEHGFYANAIVVNDNKHFLASRAQSMSQLIDSLLYYIKMANSIYPQCQAELEERRICMDKAIGVCFALLTHYQRVLTRLRIRENRHTQDIMVIAQMINSLKAWRKSDNKFKSSFPTATPSVATPSVPPSFRNQ